MNVPYEDQLTPRFLVEISTKPTSPDAQTNQFQLNVWQFGPMSVLAWNSN